jgi:type I restriction enzyme, R subunit
MKSLITEDHVEQNALEVLKKLGYEYIYGPDIEIGGKKEERNDFKESVLVERLKKAIGKLNPNIPKDARDEALKKVLRTQSPKIETDNKEFHKLLIEGVPISYRKKEDIKHDSAKLIDFKNPKNNEFLAINQFTIVGEAKRRTDILLFINGLPLVLFELKNLADENASVYEAFKQIQTYKDQLPHLFRFNEICIISDGQDARAGTFTSNFDRFMPWKTINGKKEEGLQLEILIKGMFEKSTILDLIQNFITYEKERDVKNNTTRLIKKLAAYHQYNAVNKAIESTIRAMKSSSKKRVNEDPISYGLPSVKEQKKGDKRAGIVWHTQGSGKSLSMIFYAGKLVLSDELKNPTIVVLTDRNDLDGQLFDTFVKSSDLLRQEPIQAKNRDDLKKKLKRTSGGVIFTTIQKFFPEKNKEKFPCLSERENIVVIADEAHRTQYGFDAKVDMEKGRITYGFAKYLRDALPNASFIGFTGTPIEKADKNTPAVFGKYVDVYDIKQSVEDGATVKLLYESRLAKLEIKPEERLKIDPAVEEISEDEEIKTKLKSKWSRMAEIVGSPKRLRKIAKDIINHFEERIRVMDGKGMIVCMSRKICVDLYNEIVKLRPEWHNENDNEGIAKVIMTGSASDPKDWQQHIRNKSRRTKIGDRLKDPNDELKIVLVRDMWLTGFDAPSLHTLYIDKPMKGHTLMQAIARANRKYKDKEAGLIVDYIGLGTELKKALTTYSESGGKGKPVFEQKEAVKKMKEKYNVVRDMFHGFNYKKFFELSVNERIKVIPEAIEFILKEKGKKERFVKETGLLVKAFSLSVPSSEAMKLRDEVGFFQAIKSSIVKTTSTKTKYGEEYDSAIKQIIEKSVVSDRIIDLFEAAGIEKPDMSILSDKFLLEVKDMKQKNLAFEALKKLLNDELKMFSRKNITLSKSFIEMLEKTIKRYTDQSIDAAQAIEELIRLAKRYKDGFEKGKEMGLTQEEKAFYDALAGTGNVVDLLGDEVLRKIALEIVKLVKKSAKVDWSKRKSIQAELRYQVKKVLKKYDYPPTKRADATELVLEQAKTLAENEVSK